MDNKTHFVPSLDMDVDTEGDVQGSHPTGMVNGIDSDKSKSKLVMKYKDYETMARHLVLSIRRAEDKAGDGKLISIYFLPYDIFIVGGESCKMINGGMAGIFANLASSSQSHHWCCQFIFGFCRCYIFCDKFSVSKSYQMSFVLTSLVPRLRSHSRRKFSYFV